ncbi:MAG: hypothetical protein IPK82_32100 [Polyangiaceae bacterium]|nr:hypothetical protein [Polyangiaceae bacterium]
MTGNLNTWSRGMAGAALLSLSLVSTLVRADDPPQTPPGPPATGAPNAQVSATAEALFEEGRQLLKEKKYGEACTKLNASLKIDPAIGTMLYLADCYEKNGQTASAWSMFTDAANAAGQAGQGERAVKAKLRAQNLAPKLVKLTINLPPGTSPPPGLELKRDGIVVLPALFGTAIPVDPGDHTLEASATGKKPWSGTINVPSKAGTVTAFVVPSLEDLPPPPPPPEPTATATATATVTAPPPPPPTVTATATVPPPPPPPPNTTPRTVGFVVGGVGIAGAVVASVLGMSAKSKNDEAIAAGCSGAFCPTNESLALSKDAQSLALGSTVAFVVSGVAIATGLGLVIYPSVAGPSTSSTQAPKVSTKLVVGPGGLQLSGRF